MNNKNLKVTEQNIVNMINAAMDRMSARYGKKVRPLKSKRLHSEFGDIIGVVWSSPSQLTAQSTKEVLETLNKPTIYFDSIAFQNGFDCPMNDPFAWHQNKYGIINVVLEHLARQSGKEIIIKTSSDFVATSDIRAFLVRISKRNSVRIELTSAWKLRDERYFRALMPTKPSLKRMLDAFRALKQDKLNVIKVDVAHGEIV